MLQMIAIGYLTEDIKLEKAKIGDDEVPVLNFTIACKSRNETIYKKCEAWGDAAIRMSDHAIKAARMCLIGDEKVSEYKRSDGIKIQTSVLVVDKYEFLSPKPKTLFDDTKKG